MVEDAGVPDGYEIANSYVGFRRKLRDLLHRRGIASNPMWSDDEIVAAFADLTETSE